MVPWGWDIEPTIPMGSSPWPSWYAGSHGHHHKGRPLYIHTYIQSQPSKTQARHEAAAKKAKDELAAIARQREQAKANKNAAESQGNKQAATTTIATKYLMKTKTKTKTTSLATA